MKKLMSVFAASVLVLACNEKKITAGDVPSVVTTAFDKKYQGATQVEWKQEKEDGRLVYEAEFKLNGKEMEAEFETNGNFIKEE